MPGSDLASGVGLDATRTEAPASTNLKRWAAPLLAGFALRAFFVLHHPRFLGDTLVYGDLAHNLLAHHVYGLTEERIRPTLIRLPGYPLFLALCFVLFGTGNYIGVVWVQVGVDLASCLLLALVARRLFGRRVAMCTLWLSALCPFTADYAAAALAETLSIFCVVLALWALAGWTARLWVGEGALRMAAIAGLASVGATMLRPDGVLLAVSVAGAMVLAAWVRDEEQKQVPCRNGHKKALRWRALRGALVMVAMMGVALGLWAARNWHVFHVFQPLAPKYANDPDETAPLGFARWYRTWAIGFTDSVNVYWTYDGSPLKLSDLPARAIDTPMQRAETAKIYAAYNDLDSATPEIDAGFGALAAERICAHPVRYYVLLPLARLADMWLRPRTALLKLPPDWWRVRAHPRRSVLEIVYAALNAALLILAVVGWRRWLRQRWSGYGAVAFAGAALVLLRSALLLTIDNSEPRYTLECFPVVLLLAALALAGRRETAQNVSVG